LHGALDNPNKNYVISKRKEEDALKWSWSTRSNLLLWILFKLWCQKAIHIILCYSCLDSNGFHTHKWHINLNSRKNLYSGPN
jgi:hypothetical protein